MSRKLILFTLMLALTLSACTSASSTKEAGTLTKVSLPMGYVPNIQFAPFYVAAEKGYFREAGIDIEFDYKYETDGVALVGSGELPFSLVSGEQVLLARAQGLPVQYVAAWYQQYPVSVVANSKAEVLIPQDLKGKKIGLPGLFGANYVGLLAMLYEAHMTEKDVTLDAIGFNQVDSSPPVSRISSWATLPTSQFSCVPAASRSLNCAFQTMSSWHPMGSWPVKRWLGKTRNWYELLWELFSKAWQTRSPSRRKPIN